MVENKTAETEEKSTQGEQPREEGENQELRKQIAVEMLADIKDMHKKVRKSKLKLFAVITMAIIILLGIIYISFFRASGTSGDKAETGGESSVSNEDKPKEKEIESVSENLLGKLSAKSYLSQYPGNFKRTELIFAYESGKLIIEINQSGEVVARVGSKTVIAKGINGPARYLTNSWACSGDEGDSIFVITQDGRLFASINEVSWLASGAYIGDLSSFGKKEFVFKEVTSNYKFDYFYEDYRRPMGSCVSSRIFGITTNGETREIADKGFQGRDYIIGKTYNELVPYPYQSYVCSSFAYDFDCIAIYISENREMYINNLSQPIKANGNGIFVNNIISLPSREPGTEENFVISADNKIYRLIFLDSQDELKYSGIELYSNKTVKSLYYVKASDGYSVFVEYTDNTSKEFRDGMILDQKGLEFFVLDYT